MGSRCLRSPVTIDKGSGSNHSASQGACPAAPESTGRAPEPSLESCLQPIDDLTRGDHGDALMGSDGQQVLAIPGDDQLSAYLHDSQVLLLACATRLTASAALTMLMP